MRDLEEEHGIRVQRLSRNSYKRQRREATSSEDAHSDAMDEEEFAGDEDGVADMFADMYMGAPSDAPDEQPGETGGNVLFDHSIRILHAQPDGQGAFISVPWQKRNEYHQSHLNFALIGVRWVRQQVDSEDPAAAAAAPIQLITWCRNCSCCEEEKDIVWQLFEECKEATATLLQSVEEPCPCTAQALR